jgi:hypothetical protein
MSGGGLILALQEIRQWPTLFTYAYVIQAFPLMGSLTHFFKRPQLLAAISSLTQPNKRNSLWRAYTASGASFC